MVVCQRGHFLGKYPAQMNWHPWAMILKLGMGNKDNSLEFSGITAMLSDTAELLKNL
jgi:hypothetical protein